MHGIIRDTFSEYDIKIGKESIPHTKMFSPVLMQLTYPLGYYKSLESNDFIDKNKQQIKNQTFLYGNKAIEKIDADTFWKWYDKRINKNLQNTKSAG